MYNIQFNIYIYIIYLYVIIIYIYISLGLIPHGQCQALNFAYPNHTGEETKVFTYQQPLGFSQTKPFIPAWASSLHSAPQPQEPHDLQKNFLLVQCLQILAAGGNSLRLDAKWVSPHHHLTTGG